MEKETNFEEEGGKGHQNYEEAINTLYGTQALGSDLQKHYSLRHSTVQVMEAYLRRLGIWSSLANLPVLHITGSKGMYRFYRYF